MVRDDQGAQPDALQKLQRECAQLEAQVNAQAWQLSLLRARFASYETALRGSLIAVYTQDRELRYTSITNPMYGRATDDILGRTDAEVLPEDSRATIIDMKLAALASGQAQRGEVSINDGPALHWHALHVEPMRNEAGDIVGLTCASVDVTERKESEAHLRMLLRELTHRSKNLLAVIQSMARQTARHAGSTESFLSQFGARLQALASSHDLLVLEGWHGASLSDLIHSQLSRHFEREGQVTTAGPAVALKPEAAQNLGLALHEMAVNAEKFGALSLPDGRVSITWERRGPAGALDLTWSERLGPKVKVRRKRGFGSLVIERNLTHALNAEVDMSFDPDGLRCHIVIPAAQILDPR